MTYLKWAVVLALIVLLGPKTCDKVVEWADSLPKCQDSQDVTLLFEKDGCKVYKYSVRKCNGVVASGQYTTCEGKTEWTESCGKRQCHYENPTTLKFLNK